MSDFQKAYQRTMGHEGGYANNPKDTGGQTYKGISRVHHPAWVGWKLIDSVLEGVTKEPAYGSSAYRNWVKYVNQLLGASVAIQNQVQTFYKQTFWKRLGDVADQRVAEEVFDKAVNCGQIAYKWIQRAADVEADGVIGSKSISAINSANSYLLLEEFNAQAESYYRDIVKRKPDQIVHLDGWLGRLKTYEGDAYVSVG